MTIPLSTRCPTVPGRYLFKGRYSGSLELVTVYLRLPEPLGSITFEPYLAAAGRAAHRVERFDGYWSEAIEVSSP